MHKKTLISVLAWAPLALSACGGKDDGGTGAASATNPTSVGSADSTGDASDSNSTAPTSGVTDTAESGPADTGGSDGGSDGGGSDGGITQGFIMMPDGGGAMMECDVFAQDCMDGEKCMPWANDGGSAWNATKCSPLDPAPAQVGDPCTVEGSGVSGIDNCDIAMMCWNVDENNMGTCVAFCTGTPADPMCEDPTTVCIIANDGVLALCLPSCDPLTQNCPGMMEVCYPVNEDFACAPDASGDLGAYGDPCEYINACDLGLACVAPEAVPGCAGSIGCCSEFCSLMDPMGNAQCMGEAQGQECTAWYVEGMAPPGYEDVGICAIPA